MSNRLGHYNKHETGRGFLQTQKKFVPKTLNSATGSNPTTLSTSLRQSDSSPVAAGTTTAAPASSSSSAASGSRVRLVGNDRWFPNRGASQGAGSFVNYLPQDEAVAVGLGADEGGLDAVESQRVVDLLNRELSRLLKLRPKDFWKEVASDASLHCFMDSFLQFISRWYDFPYHGAKGVVAGVIVGELELTRRVFMLLYRISSNRDPGASAAGSLSAKDHGILLQEKRLLDLPKLLDTCAIYGHENEDLTRSLVMNALKAQPGIHNKFIPMMSHFLGVVYTMYQRCNSSLEVVISVGSHKDSLGSRRHMEFLEVMDFLNDAIVSLDAFVTAYNPAAVFFSYPIEMSHGNEELIDILARLHDLLLPSLQQGLQIILADGLQKSSSLLADVCTSLKLLSMRIVDFGWKLLDYCYLNDETFKDKLPLPAASKMFPANVEDPSIRGDIFVQTLKEIAGVSLDIRGSHNKFTYLQSIQKRNHLMQRVENLQNSGWIFIDDEQRQYLAGILMHHHPMNSSKELGGGVLNSTSSTSNDPQMEEDAAILESKISQIKDLFPDYGKGYLLACLEVYNYDPEEVIQRILEGTLHEDLQALDTLLEILPPKPSSSTLSRNDKGKGKLLESLTSPTPNFLSGIEKQRPPLPQVLSSSTSSSSSSSAAAAGRFIRKAKVDEADNQTLDSMGDTKDREKTASLLLSQYEYEDEYDDSFDDLGMTVMESRHEETEILTDRIRSSMAISSGGADRESFASGAAASTKWGSRKKPQFYVKDGKNYSYKVEGSVAVANSNEAKLVTQAQKELIHGLGRGGNLPLGAVKELEEWENNVEEHQSDPSSSQGDGGNATNSQGRGGRGRRGGGGGGGRSHHRKDRALRKQMAGFTF
ncbi:hypothetical protein Dimus_028053 [Dionaea muscipula]